MYIFIKSAFQPTYACVCVFTTHLNTFCAASSASGPAWLRTLASPSARTRPREFARQISTCCPARLTQRHLFYCFALFCLRAVERTTTPRATRNTQLDVRHRLPRARDRFRESVLCCCCFFYPLSMYYSPVLAFPITEKLSRPKRKHLQQVFIAPSRFPTPPFRLHRIFVPGMPKAQDGGVPDLSPVPEWCALCLFCCDSKQTVTPVPTFETHTQTRATITPSRFRSVPYAQVKLSAGPGDGRVISLPIGWGYFRPGTAIRCLCRSHAHVPYRLIYTRRVVRCF